MSLASTCLLWLCTSASTCTILVTNRWNMNRTFFLNFFENILHSLFSPFFSLKCAPLLSQPCWATRILEHWDDCNTQINIVEGENLTSVSRFVTSIVDYQPDRYLFGSSLFGRTQIYSESQVPFSAIHQALNSFSHLYLIYTNFCRYVCFLKYSWNFCF